MLPASLTQRTGRVVFAQERLIQGIWQVCSLRLSPSEGRQQKYQGLMGNFDTRFHPGQVKTAAALMEYRAEEKNCIERLFFQN